MSQKVVLCPGWQDFLKKQDFPKRRLFLWNEPRDFDVSLNDGRSLVIGHRCFVSGTRCCSFFCCCSYQRVFLSHVQVWRRRSWWVVGMSNLLQTRGSLFHEILFLFWYVDAFPSWIPRPVMWWLTLLQLIAGYRVRFPATHFFSVRVSWFFSEFSVTDKLSLNFLVIN